MLGGVTTARAKLSMLIFDIETNGLLPSVSRVHCLSILDTDTGKAERYRRNGVEDYISAGLERLSKANGVCGHNIIDYDLPALAKVYPDFSVTGKIWDTLVMSRVIHTNLGEQDVRCSRIPIQSRGSHSLKAWGYRLGLLKGSFSNSEDEAIWEQWSPSMDDYCSQDVQVAAKLWEHLSKENYSPICLDLEHSFKRIIGFQERHGIRFDVKGAEQLAASLQIDRLKATERLRETFPPTRTEMKTPEYYVTQDGTRYPTKKAAGKSQVTPGPLRIKEEPFNPGSTQQIADRLKSLYQWEPTEFTETGLPKISETVLESLPYPEAKVLCDYKVVNKTLGMVAEGDNAWLKLSQQGRIYGRVNTNGAVTGRCTHSKPNLAQVPSVSVGKDAQGNKKVLTGLEGRYGYECRSLFMPDQEHVLVGWDASGLELRCLAHYMALYDGGAYGKILLEGDIHTANQKAAGLYSRNSAKTFILIKDDLGESPRLKLGELRETPTKDNPEPNQKTYCGRNKLQCERTAKAEKYPQGFFKRKACWRCGTEFQPDAPSHGYCSQTCADDATDTRYLTRNYGITIDDYRAMYSAQDGRCMLYGEEGFVMNPKHHRVKLVVDHCHATGAVRGLLCHNCNRGLGLFKDSIERLSNAVEYLKGATTIP